MKHPIAKLAEKFMTEKHRDSDLSSFTDVNLTASRVAPFFSGWNSFKKRHRIAA